MEKKDVTIEDIKKTIEELIQSISREKLNTLEDTPINEKLDSMALCILIINLEKMYNVEFPIEMFSREDTTLVLADKIFNLYKLKINK